MLSAKAYSFRQKARLAVWLSWIAGYTNVVALLACHVLVSHVTGNVTWFARDMTEAILHSPDEPGGSRGADEWSLVLLFAGLVFFFWLGAVFSGLLTEYAKRAGHRSKYLFPVCFEVVLLTVFTFLGSHYGWYVAVSDIWPQLILGGVAAMAMGVQNATITLISGSVVRTTHLTGVVTDLGIESVQYVLWYRDKAMAASKSSGLERNRRLIMVSARHPTIQRLVLLGFIVLSFLVGTFAGTLAYYWFRPYAMVIPILLMCWVIASALRHPIADVRELDLLQDRDFALGPHVREVLPAGVGVFRITPFHDGPTDQAPHFEGWVDRLPERWRVVVLLIAPMIRFDDEAAMDLKAALPKLRRKGRRLVLGGVTMAQYQALERSGLVELIGAENIISDPELAIAQAISVTSGRSG